MTPGSCPNETKTYGEGSKAKSYCEPWGCYTNCREVGHCTWESRLYPHKDQMTIFDVLEETCE